MTMSLIISMLLSAGVIGILFLTAFIIRRRAKDLTRENIVPHIEVFAACLQMNIAIRVRVSDSSRCDCSQDTFLGNGISLRGGAWCC